MFYNSIIDLSWIHEVIETVESLINDYKYSTVVPLIYYSKINGSTYFIFIINGCVNESALR